VSTEQQNGSQVFEGQQHGGRVAWGQEEEDHRFATTPPDGQFPMHNGGHVKFEVPKVPVIFVLGKKTHTCKRIEQLFSELSVLVESFVIPPAVQECKG
jgi:hypothetical protein